MRKTYTKKQFLKDVAKEAKALKNHATKEELEHLNFDTLLPDRVRQCIYGQMTGHCDSDRATELIKKCAPIFFDLTAGFEPTSVFKSKYIHFSPIEKYVIDDDAKNQNLIAYLKGETNDLKL